MAYMPKMEGGMGFRDLNTFNLVLLAKQGWKIQQNPNSLVHRVLKAKYFTGSSFREVQLGYRPSYVWRSIMATKDLIVRGFRWVIGNGERVHIWEDIWIPSSDSFRVVSPRGLSTNFVLVSSLINRETRGWDVNSVRNTFLPHEAEIVLGIPISPTLPDDSLVWAWTPND